MYFTNFSELMDELETANNGSRAYFQVWQGHLSQTLVDKECSLDRIYVGDNKIKDIKDCKWFKYTFVGSIYIFGSNFLFLF